MWKIILKRNLIVKKYFLFFIFSCFSLFVNAEQMKETFWGIPFGSDFSIVNDKMISKGFYLGEKTEKSSDVLECIYKNDETGKFAETKPKVIRIIISKTKGMTVACIYWSILNNEYTNNLAELSKKDPDKAFGIVARTNKEYFSTLINSLNKKYGANVNLPDVLQEFYYEILKSKNLGIFFSLQLITDGDPYYVLTYISSLYEEVVNDDV